MLSRPYHFTYELLDKAPGVKDVGLRIVPASELHADTIAEEDVANSEDPSDDFVLGGGGGVEFKLVGEDGKVVMRTNREIIDDAARQTLTMDEIETLKREGTSAGQDLIAKLMLSHTGLDQKTSFSLAKYKLLKTKKYLRRFTVLPLDVGLLTHWIMEQKDACKILEIREEMLGLLGCWSNIHYAADPSNDPSGRWLVVDDAGGLLVAAMAERMGILYPHEQRPRPSRTLETDDDSPHYNPDSTLATSNTLTLVHTNNQPNLNLLSYFEYLPNSPSDPASRIHPLATHLLPLSYLQLISPELDATYANPPPSLTPDEVAALKTGKRANHYRKMRRYARTKAIVDQARAGNFSGLAIASSMDIVSILKHVVPLLAGGAPVAIYSPTIETLVTLADLYSTSRRTAFIQSPPAELQGLSQDEIARWGGNEDFPLNPTLLLGVSVQSARVREWQVLPGRTHPLMTGKGGAEGYLLTAVRVIPAEGKVEARGKFLKRNDGRTAAVTSEASTPQAKQEVDTPPQVKIEKDLEDKSTPHLKIKVADAAQDVEMSDS